MLFKKFFILTKYTFILVTLLFPISGCTNDQSAGIIGGIIGGGAGYFACKNKSSRDRNACILGGTLVGIVAGSVIGKYMDSSDRNKLLHHFQYAPRGVNRNWENPKTGNRFTFKAISDLNVEGNKKCRSYQLWGLKKGNSKADYEKISKCI